MRFSDLLCDLNKPSLDDFRCWVFQPGMLFKSPRKWWGNLGQRDFLHEGVDFCLYQNLSGKTLQISHQTRIPVIRDGVIRRIFSDFLGQAVVVEHDATDSEENKMISIYAHTMPAKRVHVGLSVKQGDVIATLADTRRSKTPILTHLHYTLCRSSADIDYGRFVWNDMRDPDLVVLLNPLSAISDPHL